MKKKQRLTKSMTIFLFMMTFFTILMICSYAFFRSVELAHQGFLDINALKQIGFYDNDYHKYSGYWYSNGHLHPFYVGTLEYFYNSYLIDCTFNLVVILYVLIKTMMKGEVPYSKKILIFTFVVFALEATGFVITTIYFIVNNGAYPALQAFIIYLIKMIFFTFFILFYIFNKRKQKEISTEL